MDIVLLTIFPEMITPYFECGMIRKAVDEGYASATALNIRDYASGKHRVTDDKPYGGGCGMVMKPEPLAAAVRAAKERVPGGRVIHLSPQGRPFSQSVAYELSRSKGLIFVCGRYEGVDDRVCYDYIDEEISIGDYVLTGGELAAMVVADAVVRLIPGVLGGDESADKDTFSDGLIEHAHFTRPYEFEGNTVPEVLLSGNHAKIDQWRLETSLIRTFLKRPDLLENRLFSKDEKAILRNWCKKIELLVG